MIRRLASNGRLSQAVVANGFVFVSGQATEEPQKNVADQMRDALEEAHNLGGPVVVDVKVDPAASHRDCSDYDPL